MPGITALRRPRVEFVSCGRSKILRNSRLFCFGVGSKCARTFLRVEKCLCSAHLREEDLE
jgi:hypothetical protein